MLRWIGKHRKALAVISLGVGVFFAVITMLTYRVMAADTDSTSGNSLINIGISTGDAMIWPVFCRCCWCLLLYH